jgi:hypothetical protein
MQALFYSKKNERCQREHRSCLASTEITQLTRRTVDGSL